MIDFKFLMEILLPLLAISGVFWKLQVNFDRHEKEDARELQVIREDFNKHDKNAIEFFDRINKLEMGHSAQLEINRNLSDNWTRIERKLDSIEGMLRNRRSSDQ